MELHMAVILYALERLESCQLPQIATDALAKGYDSPSLRLLAGEMNPTMADSFPLFERILKELNIALLSKSEAGLEMAKYYANLIISDSIDPYEGSKKIWEICEEIDSISDQLTIFSELSWGYESNEPLRPFNSLTKEEVLQRIKTEAKKLLKIGGERKNGYNHDAL